VPLLARSCHVFTLDRRTGEATPGITPIRADLSRPLDLSLLPSRIDAVIYLAQSNRFREFPDAADDIFQVNAAQLLAMLEHARLAGATHFVHASSGSVYDRSSKSLTEQSPLAQAGALGFYAATKLAGELLASSYAPWMTIANLRFFFIYGAGQQPDRLVPRLVESVRAGRPVTLGSRDGMRLNPVHASEAAAAVVAALQLEETAIINVAGPEILSIREIAETIGGSLGVEPVFRSSDDDSSDLIGDTTAMRRLLVPPERRFRDAVAELV
jgi:nucleoside-diphosphate-sugar epimerase